MKTKTCIRRLRRRKFEGIWDRILYCHAKLLYWLYGRDNRSRAKYYCRILEPLLLKAASKHEAIKGEECWSLLFEARGDFDRAILYRNSEIKLIKRLLRLKPRLDEYGPGDLADRLVLLGVLYFDSGRTRRALTAIREAKRICQRNRIRFDDDDLLKEYESQRRGQVK